MRRAALAAVALAVPLALGAPVARAYGADTVADLVFAPGLLGSLSEPVLIDYVYLREDGTTKATTRGDVRMDVREVAPNGRKAVWFDMFDGPDRRAFGPVEMTSQNPLLIVFLQRDVTAMESLTGGSQHYFRNRLREAFAGPAEVERAEVTFEGRTVPAARVTIRPFRDDARIDRFPQFRTKAYEFTVAEGVPGGVWRLATRVDDPKTGELVLAESVTLAGARPSPEPR